MLADVERALYNLSLQDVLKCKDILKLAIDEAYRKHKLEVVSKDIDEYVEYTKTFISPESVDFASLEADLEGLNIGGKRKGTRKCWLTTTNLPYTWKSKGKNITNQPVNITQFNSINKIMLDLNNKYDIELNSCLVTYYQDGSSGLRLHHDGEDDMDSDQPICVVSVGTARNIEFLDYYQHYDDHR